MATGTSLSHVFPLGSRLNERGRLEIGGCDTVELAKELGTPAYVVAEDDLRARARAFVRAGAEAGHGDFHVVFASKAFPCTAVLALFAQEGLWCDVASAGELHLALNAGYAAERIVMHGNAKSEAELSAALGVRVGLIVVDNSDELDRLERLTGAGALDLGLTGDLGVDGLLGDLRVAAGGRDQAGGGAFLIVQQCLQQVFRGDPLVELADRDGLGGLQEAARTLGELLDIHLSCPWS